MLYLLIFGASISLIQIGINGSRPRKFNTFLTLDVTSSDYSSSTFITENIDKSETNSEEIINHLNAVDEEFREWLDEMANYDVDEEAVQKTKKVDNFFVKLSCL